MNKYLKPITQVTIIALIILLIGITIVITKEAWIIFGLAFIPSILETINNNFYDEE